MTLIYNMNI